MKLVNLIGKEKSDRVLVLVLAFFLLLMFTLENINGRFWLNDFKVMYQAADAYLHGKTVYGVSFGLETGYYKYSPVTLFFFVPFTFLPYEWAAIVQFFLIGLAFMGIIRRLTRLLGNGFPNDTRYWFYLVFFVSIVVHFTRELHLGNVNVFLIFLIIQALLFWKIEKYVQGALLMAVVLLTKPYFLVLALPFILTLKWRELFYTGLSVLTLVLFSFILDGWNNAGNLYQEWFKAMLDHSSYLTSDHTVFSILEQFTGIHVSSNLTLLIFAGTAIILMLILFLSWKKTEKSGHKMDLVHFSLFVLIAITPNFLITDTEHFLFAIPIIWFLSLHFFTMSWSEKNILFIGILLYAFNPVKEWGTLGIGNLLLVVLAVYKFINTKGNLAQQLLNEHFSYK